MQSEKEYWEQMIGFILLIFATYTITKDLINENRIGIILWLDKSSTINAIFYAGIMDILIMIGFIWFRNHLKKQGKLN
ncbi:hypothetical protein METP2_00054 [Methanosarcinales archaeon]|nr:hypothetical protein METP2_00054 [Methanosarcinales archaeon]